MATKAKKTEQRVLAFRIPAKDFDTLTKFCETNKISKTQAVVDGLKRLGVKL